MVLLGVCACVCVEGGEWLYQHRCTIAWVSTIHIHGAPTCAVLHTMEICNCMQWGRLWGGCECAHNDLLCPKQCVPRPVFPALCSPP